MIATTQQYFEPIIEEGKPTGWWEEPAPLEAVEYMLKQKINLHQENDFDGRSHWVWIRLPDGDLVLAFYPQGDAYFSTEHWQSI